MGKEQLNQAMNPFQEVALLQTRRQFFGGTTTVIGAAALAGLLNPDLFGATDTVHAVKIGDVQTMRIYARISRITRP
jgi:hypothetical protein